MWILCDFCETRIRQEIKSLHRVLQEDLQNTVVNMAVDFYAKPESFQPLQANGSSEWPLHQWSLLTAHYKDVATDDSLF